MSGKYVVARDAFGVGALSWTKDDIAAHLVSTVYRFDEAHKSIDDIDGAVGDAVALRNARIVDGWTRCDELNFRQVNGREAVGIVFFRETDGKLIEYHDAIDMFPLFLNGGDINITVAEPGIFRI